MDEVPQEITYMVMYETMLNIMPTKAPKRKYIALRFFLKRKMSGQWEEYLLRYNREYNQYFKEYINLNTKQLYEIVSEGEQKYGSNNTSRQSQRKNRKLT